MNTKVAKQNYTMLDNLKLGYGGTKTEMERLIADANRVKEANGEMADLSIERFADVVEAIHIIQTEMGITGTTAIEAGRTISGSVASMKSAWTNLLTGLANGNADIENLVNQLVTTIVGDGTENNLGVLGNVLPAVERALVGVVRLIEGAAPKIIEILPGLVEQIVPALISAATSMVNSIINVLPSLLKTIVTAIVDNVPLLLNAAINLVKSLIQGIRENYQIIIDATIDVIKQISSTVLEMLPEILSLGMELLVSLALGIAESIPTLIPTITSVILQIVQTLTSPEQLELLLNAALILITELSKGLVSAIPALIDASISIVNNFIDFILDEKNLNTIIDAALQIILIVSEGLIKAIPKLVDATISIIEKLCEFFLDPENISMLLDMAFQIITAIVQGLLNAAVELVKGAGELVGKLIDVIIETDWLEIGKNIVTGLWDGIKSLWGTLTSWFSDAWDGLVSGTKEFLGIHSPSRVFAGIGENMALGVGKGWKDGFADVKKDINKSMFFEAPYVSKYPSASGSFSNKTNGSSIGNLTINIDGAKYNDEQSLADAIAEVIQERIERSAAVYA